MMPTITNRFLPVAALVIAASLAHAQAYTPPPPKLVTGPCVPTKEFPCDPPPAASSHTSPSTPSQFAFPGEPGDPKPATAAPATNPTTKSPGAPPSDPFAFPGEPEEHPAAKPAPATTPDKFAFPDEAESSSSSSNPSSAPAAEDKTGKSALADKGSSGSTRAQRRHLPKVEDLDHRESEDLEISHYYVTTGNFLAAYLRAKDAVKTIPDDPLAHFALAETAARLNKKDEAIAEYQAYLKLDPDGEKGKQSRQALASLTKP